MGDNLALNEDKFEEEVIKSSMPVLLDLWAPWCGPCKMIGPIIEGLAEDYNGKLKVRKINVDDNPGIAATLGIRGIPTLLIYKDGRETERIVGAVSEAEIKSKIDSVIS